MLKRAFSYAAVFSSVKFPFQHNSPMECFLPDNFQDDRNKTEFSLIRLSDSTTTGLFSLPTQLATFIFDE